MTRIGVGIARAALRVIVLSGVVLGPFAASVGAAELNAAAPAPSVGAAPLGCSAGDLPLRIGRTGQCVRYVQGALQIIGFGVGPSGADGGFGPDTQAAVQAWQVATGRPATGEIADLDELALLVSMTESGEGDPGEGEPSPDPAPGDDVAGFPLQIGSSGENVQRAQQWLVEIGFGVGSSGADGHFGPATQAAVQAWQTAAGLPVTGVLTSDDYNLLGAAGEGGDDGEPTSPADLGDGLPLHVGSSGPRVAQLQQMLVELGFGVGASGSDGQFGPATQAAVQSWQAAAGHAADGVITETQFNELSAATAAPANVPESPAATPPAPVPGEAHVLWSTTEHNTRTSVYDVVGGVATAIPGIDPMMPWSGDAAWSADLATLYLTDTGLLRAIDLATLGSTSVACGDCSGLTVTADGTVVTLESNSTALGFTPTLEPAFTVAVPAFFESVPAGVAWIAGSVDDDLIVAATTEQGAQLAVARVRPDGLAAWTFESLADTTVFGGFAVAPSGSHAAFVRPVAADEGEPACFAGGEVMILDLNAGAANPLRHTVSTAGGATQLSSPTGLVWAGDTLYASHPVTATGADNRFDCPDFAAHTLWATDLNTWTSIDVGQDRVALGVPTSGSTFMLSIYDGGTQGDRSLMYQRAGGPLTPLLDGGQLEAVSPIAEDHREVMTADLANATPVTPSVPSTVPPATPSGVGPLSGAGIADAHFGDHPDEVIAELTPLLGAPTEDLGWQPITGDELGICLVDQIRSVHWGNLSLLFAYWDFSTNTATEQPRFLQYSYFSYDIELTPEALQGLTTDRGLALGDPIARLIELYPDVDYYYEELGGGGSFTTGDGLGGGLDIGDRPEPGSPEDVVNGIIAGGFPCGE